SWCNRASFSSASVARHFQFDTAHRQPIALLQLCRSYSPPIYERPIRAAEIFHVQRAAGGRDLTMQARDERHLHHEFGAGRAADGLYRSVGNAKGDPAGLRRVVFENPHYWEDLDGSGARAFFSRDEISSTAAGLMVRSLKLPYSATSPVTARVNR